MKKRYLFPVLFVLTVFLSGCSSSSGITVTRTSASVPLIEDRNSNASASVRENGKESMSEPVIQDTESGSEEPSEPLSETVLQDEICVYVCGAVVSPGVYRFESGMRVVDAIAAAGGFLPGADTEWLNQAEILTDQEMLIIYDLDETAQMEAAGLKRGETAVSGGTVRVSAHDQDTSGGKVNLNTAGKEELMTLSGIGESKAEAIIRYREENGPYASPEDVMNISGIKENVYAKIRDHVAV